MKYYQQKQQRWKVYNAYRFKLTKEVCQDVKAENEYYFDFLRNSEASYNNILVKKDKVEQCLKQFQDEQDKIGISFFSDLLEQFEPNETEFNVLILWAE